MPKTEMEDLDEVYWYVMLHRDPKNIDKMLRFENQCRTEAGKEPLVFIIPYLYLKPAVELKDLSKPGEKAAGATPSDVAEANELRGYLHSFVFIKSSRRELDQLLDSHWNRDGSSHLHYYRSRSRRPVHITELEMTPLIGLFVEHRQKFSFLPIDTKLEEKDVRERTVRIRKGLFKNCMAVVSKAVKVDKSFRLTLTINAANGEFPITLYDYTNTDVDWPNGSIEQVFGPYFVRNMELELLEVLRRRVFRHKVSAEQQKADQDLLQKYSLFNYLIFEDSNSQTHFKALKLLCASMRKDQETKATLLKDFSETITQLKAPQTDEEAFILAVLFAATRKGELRKVVKEYCQTHTITSDSLQRIMPIVKEIQTR